jgi:hypothetical protein
MHSSLKSESTFGDCSKSGHTSDVFLPRLLPGETIYSLCARYSSANSMTPEEASNALLGHSRGARKYVVPFGLARLESAYAGSFPVDQHLVRQRTTLGAVLPFMPAQQRQLVLEAVRDFKPDMACRKMLGINRGSESIGLVLRRCPDCARSDVIQHGFSYWRTVHQFAGVWVCPWHMRPLQWLPPTSAKVSKWELAQRRNGDFQELSVDAHALELLIRVAFCVIWTASQYSLGPTALAIMARAKLHQAGLFRNEICSSADELMHVHSILALPLARSQIPHFLRFTDMDWIAKTFGDPDFARPLRWTVLLASSMPHDWYHPKADSNSDGFPVPEPYVDFEVPLPTELDREYVLARARAPQLKLFDEGYACKRLHAPIALYNAVGEGFRLEIAAQAAGMTLTDAQRWMRKDPALSQYRHTRVAEIRTEQARYAIADYLRSHPNAMRSTVLRSQIGSVRSLERYAPELLQALLPPVQPKYNRQLTLPLMQ